MPRTRPVDRSPGAGEQAPLAVIVVPYERRVNRVSYAFDDVVTELRKVFYGVGGTDAIVITVEQRAAVTGNTI